MTAPAPLLQVDRAQKRFGGLVAVDEASLDVAAGSITGLIGPNGSGKTTLFNCIAGVLPLDGGAIRLNGRPIAGLAPHQICSLGVARTFQISRLFGEMTVLENLVAVAPHASDAAAIRRALELLDFLEIGDLGERFGNALSYGQRKLVEIARALILDPKVMLLDEPFAGINPRLQNRIVDHLQRLQRDGLTLFLVDHEMRIVLDICETVHVMDQGRVIVSAPPAEVRRDPRVLEAYF